MPLPKPRDRAPDRLSRLISAVVLLVLAVLVFRDLTRSSPSPAHAYAFRRGPGEPIPTPLKPGDACPDPMAHTGPYDPRSGRPRHGGYKTVEQIDAEAAEAVRRRP